MHSILGIFAICLGLALWMSFHYPALAALELWWPTEGVVKTMTKVLVWISSCLLVMIGASVMRRNR
jgi:hypothetical protein